MINEPLLRRTWGANRGRIALVALALAVWGFLMPVVYATFGRQLETLLQSGIIPAPFLRLLGADPFSLNGAVALGAVHPFAIGLQVIYPIGFACASIAGERQRGTLEVLLSRPLSRRSLIMTLLVAVVGVAAVTTAAELGGTWAGAAAYGVAGGLDTTRMLELGANTLLLLTALGAVSLAASASFDRLTPALGVGLAVLLLGYVVEVLGTIWPDAAWLQPLSPFHYLQPLEILAGDLDTSHPVVLAVVAILATGFALWRFPRRDLAAPT